jgi:hypothetical protein
MHNLHYLLVEADNGQEACGYAEGQIESFGDENNWRTICGATRINGEIYNTKEGRWEAVSLDEIKKGLVDAIFNTSGEEDFSEKCFHEALAKFNAKQKMTGMDWYYVRKYAEEAGAKVDCLSQGGKVDLTPEAFDPFEHEDRSWKLDEFGVTHLLHGNEDPENKKNLWLVAVDMHS